MSQKLERVMEILDEAYETAESGDFAIEFKTPDGQRFTLGQFEVDEDHETVTVDLKPAEDCDSPRIS